MSKSQMTVVTIAATNHVVGAAFARGNANPKAAPTVAQLVGDGFPMRNESDGSDLFKIPASELVTTLVDFNRDVFRGAPLNAGTFPGPSDRLFYQVANGAAVPILTPNTKPSKLFKLTASGLVVTVGNAVTVATGAWALLFSAPDKVIVPSAGAQIDIGNTSVNIPVTPDASATYVVLGLLAGYLPAFATNVSVGSTAFP